MKTILTILLLLTTLLTVFAPDTQAQGLIQDNFDQWNSQISDNLPTTIDQIINRLVLIIFSLSGLILLVMLIWGGFQMLTAGTNPEQAETGKKVLTTAIFGFVIIFTSYWLIQILEVVFGITILSG